jgi:hypothetical protein
LPVENEKFAFNSLIAFKKLFLWSLRLKWKPLFIQSAYKITIIHNYNKYTIDHLKQNNETILKNFFLLLFDLLVTSELSVIWQ